MNSYTDSVFNDHLGSITDPSVSKTVSFKTIVVYNQFLSVALDTKVEKGIQLR